MKIELKGRTIIHPYTKLQRLWWIIKGYLGFSSIKDNSTCWFSYYYFDVHDYKKNKGGDGYPSHFFVYTCSRCRGKFYI